MDGKKDQVLGFGSHSLSSGGGKCIGTGVGAQNAEYDGLFGYCFLKSFIAVATLVQDALVLKTA